MHNLLLGCVNFYLRSRDSDRSECFSSLLDLVLRLRFGLDRLGLRDLSFDLDLDLDVGKIKR